jgi:two-component system sensor histidine kinase RegB
MPNQQNANRQNLLQLIKLRLIAVFGQMLTIFFAVNFLEISLPIFEMLLVVLALILLNCASFYRYKFHQNISDKSLFFELLFDVGALCAQLYLSGGISNPFISLFLLQVIIGAILLEQIYAVFVALATLICYVWLGFHYRQMHEFHHHSSDNFFNLHLQGMLISYVFATILVLIFVSKISKNLQKIKEQKAKEEQIVKIALLATSTAHELGTPLAIISVLLGDLKNSSENFLSDVSVMQNQLNRCKKILSQMLEISGNQRLEEAQTCEVKKFFDDLVLEWQETRNAQNLIFEFIGKSNAKLIFNQSLRQSFFSVLDNALEASPHFILLKVSSKKNQIIVIVEDKGSGFSPQILNKIGSPNISTKNSSGLGLFLAINALATIDATLRATNLKNGGAKIEIKIPLK